MQQPGTDHHFYYYFAKLFQIKMNVLKAHTDVLRHVTITLAPTLVAVREDLDSIPMAWFVMVSYLSFNNSHARVRP